MQEGEGLLTEVYKIVPSCENEYGNSVEQVYDCCIVRIEQAYRRLDGFEQSADNFRQILTFKRNQTEEQSSICYKTSTSNFDYFLGDVGSAAEDILQLIQKCIQKI